MTDAEYLELATFIYATKFCEIEKTWSLQQCVDELKAVLEDDIKVSAGGMNKKEWSAFADKMQAMIDHDPSFGEYIVGDYKKDDDTGFRAITFVSPDGKDAAVAFRGTAEPYGWADNGKGMYLSSSTCQREAAEYIEKIHNQYVNAAISVTGHSKGGNLAQYVTIVCPYIAKCVAFDGQGFSTAFIDTMKKNCPEFEELCKKIKNVSAEGDFVNCLGTSIAGTIKFVPTVDLGVFSPDYHSPWYLVKEIDESFNLPEDGEAKWYAPIITDITVNLSNKGVRSAPLMELAMFAASILTRSDKLNALKESVKLFVDSIANELNYYVVEPVLEWVDFAQKQLYGMYSAVKVEVEKLYQGAKEFVVEKVLKVASYAEMAYKAMLKGIDKIQEAVKETVEFVGGVARKIVYLSETAVMNISKKIVTDIELIGKGVRQLMGKVSSGKQYASEHPVIKLDTSKFRSYAGTLKSINSTLMEIDRQMNSLYLRVGFTDLWSLLKADLGTSYSFRLQQCINYLEDTAADFEGVESAIVAKI